MQLFIFVKIIIQIFVRNHDKCFTQPIGSNKNQSAVFMHGRILIIKSEPGQKMYFGVF